MYIHQTKDWPNFRWNEKLVNPKQAKVCKAVGFLEGRLSVLGFDVQQQAAVEAITHDIVASSEIEGVMLNTEQVRSSVARRMGVHIANETEPSHYIDGIVEMMTDAVNNYSQPLTAERLYGWHNCLFPTGRSGMEVINVGKYRTDEMDVVSGTLGREKVHYHAPAATLVATEMERFLDWFNSESTATDYIKSAVAHFWFVSIHPFDDGNGRIGRAIAETAISQANNSAIHYFSISRQINKEKKYYSRILERCQKGECEITAWIDWYLDCMLRAVDGADNMLSGILKKAVFWQNHSQELLNDRQIKVLNIYLDGYIGKLTVKNWAKHASVSVDTAARDIKQLTDSGILIPQQGQVRNVQFGIAIDKDNLLIPHLNDNDE